MDSGAKASHGPRELSIDEFDLLQSDDALLVDNSAPLVGLTEEIEDAVDGCPRAALRIDEA